MQEKLEELHAFITGSLTIQVQYWQTNVLPDIEHDISVGLQQGQDILEDINELYQQLANLQLVHLKHVKDTQLAENVGT